jgi:hypothetical protein
MARGLEGWSRRHVERGIVEVCVRALGRSSHNHLLGVRPPLSRVVGMESHSGACSAGSVAAPWAAAVASQVPALSPAGSGAARLQAWSAGQRVVGGLRLAFAGRARGVGLHLGHVRLTTCSSRPPYHLFVSTKGCRAAAA